MTKVHVNKIGVFGGQLSRRSVCMADSCPGGQLSCTDFHSKINFYLDNLQGKAFVNLLELCKNMPEFRRILNPDDILDHMECIPPDSK